MNAIIVTRFSDESQRGNTSTEVQLDTCRAYCDRMGYKVIGEKNFEAESAGASNTRRVDELLKFCEAYKGKAQVLVLYKLDRLARDKNTHFYITRALIKLGLAMRSATEPVDDSPSGQLLEGVLASIAQFENDIKRERVTASMRQLLSRGIWQWKAPLGYLNQKTSYGKAGVAAIDSACAKDVIEIFRLFSTAKYTQEELVVIMNKRQVIDGHGRRIKFHDMKINRILRDPFYIGRLRSTTWGEEFEGAHQPLIDLKTFERCQALLAPSPQRGTVRLSVNPDFPLRDRLYCGKCNQKMRAAFCRGRNKKPYALYYCFNPNCKAETKSVKAGVFEQEFYKFLTAFKLSEPKVKRLMEKLVERYEARKAEFESQSDRQRKLIDAAMAEKQRVVEMGLKGLLDDEDYKVQYEKAKQTILDLKQENMGTTVEEFKLEYLISFASEAMRNMGNLWNQAEPQAKVKLQRLLFPERIVYSHPGFSETPHSSLLSLITDQLLSQKDNNVSVLPIGDPGVINIETIIQELKAWREVISGVFPSYQVALA